MTAERITIATEAELGAQIKEAAAADGVSVSAWMSRAARARLRQQALGDLLEEWQAEHGQFTEAERAWAREAFEAGRRQKASDRG
jgi:hypothetical protein